jgi:3-phosphoshikimate 1-carboxyvinyltransferase
MVYGALNSEISIHGLSRKTVQGDAAMLAALEKCSVDFKWVDSVLHINKSVVVPFKFDANECPDLFPALVVLAAAANGKSEISGIGRLLHKESNRAIVLQSEFDKLGLKIKLENDIMHIYGCTTLKSGKINAHNDHRIAMAGAIAASLTDQGITVEGAACVAKSYPDFWNNFSVSQ